MLLSGFRVWALDGTSENLLLFGWGGGGWGWSQKHDRVRERRVRVMFWHLHGGWFRAQEDLATHKSSHVLTPSPLTLNPELPMEPLNPKP